MKVYVGMFRYIYDGDYELVVATTKERIEQELVKKAERYVEYLDEDERNSLDKANSFHDWNDIGCNNEWFELQWTQCEVQSDDHILKHAMETI